MDGGPWGSGLSLTSTGLATGSPFNQQVRGVGTPGPRAWVDGAHPLTPGPGGDSLSPALTPAPTPGCRALGGSLFTHSETDWPQSQSTRANESLLQKLLRCQVLL